MHEHTGRDFATVPLVFFGVVFGVNVGVGTGTGDVDVVEVALLFDAFEGVEGGLKVGGEVGRWRNRVAGATAAVVAAVFPRLFGVLEGHS